MQRLVALSVLLALASCSKDTPPPTPPPTTDAAAADAEGSDAEGDAAAQEEAKKKAAEQQARLDQMIAAAEKRAEGVRARWTPEVTAKYEKIVGKKYNNDQKRMKAVLGSPHRTEDNAARDAFRRPRETMKFFGLRSDMKVFEVAQGAGWYTEVLAPFLARDGKLYLAGAPEQSDDPTAQAMKKSMDLFLSAPGPLYEKVELVPQAADRSTPMSLGEAGSLDMVVLFRMMHNVHRAQLWDGWMPSIHAALADGGVLAVVQHRAADDANPDESANTGYMPEPWLVEKIEGYGFKLEARSDVNANAKDTHDHPKGVWTLPPTFALGDEDRDKYAAIGESDRSTLKFVKVAK